MADKLTEGVDFYFNDQGLMVLTEKYHLDRGYCCGNGCMHCPFDYIGVAEPQRTRLLEKRNNDLSKHVDE